MPSRASASDPRPVPSLVAPDPSPASPLPGPLPFPMPRRPGTADSGVLPPLGDIASEPVRHSAERRLSSPAGWIQ